MFNPPPRRTIITLIATLIFASALTLPAGAQGTRHRNGHGRRRITRTTQLPAALVRSQSPGYLSGEANVTVRANQNPLIRLGMAQNGVTIVEFPASDRFFAIHPGNEELVTVEKSPTRATDHHIVLRAGSGFTPPSQKVKRAAEPSTSIIAQMRSGMVITLMIYPVRELAQQAHRCVISYNRSEVMAARQATGLATNLGEADSTQTVKTAETMATAAAPKAAPLPSPTPEARKAPDPEPVLAEIERKAKKRQGTISDPVQLTKEALAEAVRNPKQFKRWTSPAHGLVVSTAQSRDINDHSRIVVVAVRNTKSEAIRIVPGHPELFIETLDDQRKPLQVEKIKRLRVETTAIESSIPAGATIYYALIYETPILGAKQHLRVAVGQTNAADEPASADLTATAR